VLIICFVSLLSKKVPLNYIRYYLASHNATGGEKVNILY